MSAERISAPEGIEFDTNIYLVSDEGVEAVVALKGAASVPTFDRAEAAILSAKLTLAPLSDASWRVMTRAEIADYKERESSPPLNDDEEEF